MVNCKFHSISDSLNDFARSRFGWEFPIPGQKFGDFRGITPPKTVFLSFYSTKRHFHQTASLEPLYVHIAWVVRAVDEGKKKNGSCSRRSNASG